MTRVVLALLLFAAVPLTAGDYVFRLNGEPVHPRILPVMSDRKGLPAPGDIAFVEDQSFVLREAGNYALRTRHDGGHFLHARIDDGAEFLAGVTVAFGHSKLPPADWRTTVLTIRPPRGNPAAAPPPPADAPLPALPGNLRYLTVKYPAHARLPAGIAPFARLPALVCLSLELPPESAAVRHLGHWPQLRNLDIIGGTLSHPAALADLSALRFLKLRSVRGLDSVEFAARLPELRVLKIDGTAVTDLRPLEGAGNLRLLSANQTPVAHLPDLATLPALADLRLHSTPVARNKALLTPLRSRTSILVKNWDPAIKGFEQHDAAHPPAENPILFIGSSSIRLWDLKKSFPDHLTLNRGFGGSELSDALRYFDRIVLPYRPRAILLYAGDNDIGNGETAEQVIADYHAFANRVRSQLPKTDFAYIPIKPSLKRWELWTEMARANAAIRKLTEADPKLHYLDTATATLGANGKPRPDFFVDDGLHLNKEGYKAWTAVVKPWLEEL